MRAYRPIVRHVAVAMLTPTGWVRGELALPQLQHVAEHLARAGAVVKLVSVCLPGRLSPVPFVALQHGAISLVTTTAEEGRTRDRDATPHATFLVTFTLQTGLLEGRLTVPASLRLSDFLHDHRGFVAVEDAWWTARDRDAAQGEELRQHLPFVFVNTANVVGAEEAAPRPHGAGFR